MNRTSAPIDIGAPSAGFLTLCAFLVFFMTVGLGLFYSGLTRPKNSLSLFMLCMSSLAIVNIQWYLFGFSLAFSETGSVFLGDTTHFVFQNVNQYALVLTAPTVPSIVFALYQLMFATITPALIFGAVAERIRLLPSAVFVFAWATVVYCPTAYWTWAARGWLRNLSCLGTAPLPGIPCQVGVYDFAGGGPVHVAAGFSALAFALFIGPRKNVSQHLPSSMINVFLGTGILWFGWFAFNGGSGLAATSRSALAAFNTTLAASTGAITWVAWDFLFLKRLSGLSFCSGAVAAMAAVTPAAGFVEPWAAIIIGCVGGLVTNLMCRLKDVIHYDDTLDCFNIHGVGGFIGLVLTGIFCTRNIAGMDGTVIPGGAIDGNAISIGYQLVAAVCIASWSFVVSLILLFIINLVPALKFRSTPEQELRGDDAAGMGEFASAWIGQEERNSLAEAWNGSSLNVSVSDKAARGTPAPRLRRR